MHTRRRRSSGASRAVSSNPLRVIVFTQGHADHVGGWSQLDRTGRRDHRAGEPRRRPRVLAEAAAVLLQPHREALARATSRTSTARTSRPSRSSPRPSSTRHAFTLGRPSFRALRDAGRRDDRLAGGVAARGAHRVHRQPHGTAVRPRAQPLHAARRQVPQRDRVPPRPRPRARASNPRSSSPATASRSVGADEIRRRRAAGPRRHRSTCATAPSRG